LQKRRYELKKFRKAFANNFFVKTLLAKLFSRLLPKDFFLKSWRLAVLFNKEKPRNFYSATKNQAKILEIRQLFYQGHHGSSIGY